MQEDKARDQAPRAPGQPTLDTGCVSVPRFVISSEFFFQASNDPARLALACLTLGIKIFDPTGFLCF